MNWERPAVHVVTQPDVEIKADFVSHLFAVLFAICFMKFAEHLGRRALAVHHLHPALENAAVEPDAVGLASLPVWALTPLNLGAGRLITVV